MGQWGNEASGVAQIAETQMNIIRTSIRMALDIHKRLNTYVDSRKYTPQRTSIDATVQRAVRDFLDKEEGESHTFRNPSPIYPKGNNEIRSQSWRDALDDLRQAGKLVNGVIQRVEASSVGDRSDPAAADIIAEAETALGDEDATSDAEITAAKELMRDRENPPRHKPGDKGKGKRNRGGSAG